MNDTRFSQAGPWVARAFLLGLGLVLGACSTPPNGHIASSGFYDPFEDQNRTVHGFNLDVDRVLFRPASLGFTDIVPDPIEDSISYFSDNLSMPRITVNALLQGDLRTAGTAVGRFVMNSTIGFVGLADPATEFGIPNVDADFGQTLSVWGFQEGAFLELPFLGPSTERDAIGIVVDIALNPFSYIGNNPLGDASLASEVMVRLSDRGRFSDTVDSILYESADSYAQGRLIYLQNRRFELGTDTTEDYFDPYSDPYEDPYALE